MHQPPDILALAYKQPLMQDQLILLHEQTLRIPQSFQYHLKRYEKKPQWSLDDIGMLVYHYEKADAGKNYLELKFCITGNVYCNHQDNECDLCKFNHSKNCTEKRSCVDVISFQFEPAHLSRIIKPQLNNITLSEDILNFRHASSFTKLIPICSKTRAILESLLQQNYPGSLGNIFISAQTYLLMLYTLDCMIGEKDLDVINCKFLANEADREKISRAREILIEHISEPITIRELSRKVAINECYLKKGFKEMFGSTIFDFYQSQRMEHAKYLLYEKGLNVTEVSLLLGYSSISHFSTAFKKHTGLKPCELLFK